MTFINVFNLWLYLVLFFIVIPFLWEYFLIDHPYDYYKRFYVIISLVLIITFFGDMFAIINTIIKLFR